jgi:hypothetical protein
VRPQEILKANKKAAYVYAAFLFANFYSILVPHSKQNLLDRELEEEHFGQVFSIGAPQSVQNFP